MLLMTKKVGRILFRKVAYNVPTLGEGGDYNHKCRCGEQMLNTAVNVERSTAPPLLPSVCYRLFFCQWFILVRFQRQNEWGSTPLVD
mgnify:CR=1 FL=1